MFRCLGVRSFLGRGIWGVFLDNKKRENGIKNKDKYVVRIIYSYIIYLRIIYYVLGLVVSSFCVLIYFLYKIFWYK